MRGGEGEKGEKAANREEERKNSSRRLAAEPVNGDAQPIS